MGRKFTQRQLNALDDAGVLYDLRDGGREIFIAVGYDGQALKANTGVTGNDIAPEATEEHTEKARKVLERVPTAYKHLRFRYPAGGWTDITRAEQPADKGEWCDTAAAWHY